MKNWVRPVRSRSRRSWSDGSKLVTATFPEELFEIKVTVSWWRPKSLDICWNSTLRQRSQFDDNDLWGLAIAGLGDTGSGLKEVATWW
ncbi:hypothetical protein LWI29_006717 [Acer saccharum]|uniref:Uncharacterized protein n=1 Tax=Acer saccharum TaxID=4024 RepID=A0AA39RU87_ACESA|nr:hypothetical protein LWI29_006717 [Acer saccharum]